ncbi:MAG TPA: DMT family transporter [Hyphomicrobiaceae bacterium]|nr:DMT family transporter [Hyphomicrobiaceae bacterium]
MGSAPSEQSLRASVSAQVSPHNNVLAIITVIGAGFFLICSDACLRIASSELPLGQVVAGRSVVGCILLGCAAWTQSALSWHPAILTPAFGLRVLGEVGAALFFIAAILRMPFANAAAILQFIPLVTTVVAAWLFAERVGWQRWSAGAVGLVGVLLVLQPGTSGFTWWSLLAVAAMLCMSLRDLATTRIDRSAPTLLVGAVSAAGVALGGLALLPFAPWPWPSGEALLLMVASGVFVAGGFYCMVQAMRLGEISAVAPFRYGTMLWALLVGIVVWGEIPNFLAVIGILIVIAAGLAMFAHERRLMRARLGERR